MSQTNKANTSSAISAKEVHVYIKILNEFQPSVFCNSVTRRAPNRQPRETSKHTLRNRALRVASPPKPIHASSIVPAAIVSLKFCFVMRARVFCNSVTRPPGAESVTERDIEAYVKESHFESGLPAKTNPRKFYCTCCVRLTQVLLGHACAGC